MQRVTACADEVSCGSAVDSDTARDRPARTNAARGVKQGGSRPASRTSSGGAQASAPSSVSTLYAREFQRFTGIDAGLHSARHREGTLRCGGRYDQHAVVQRVSGGVFCAAFADAVRLTADRDLGFRFGAAISGRGLGLLGISAATAPTLAQALKSLLRWEPLVGTLGRIRASRTRRQLRLTWDAAHRVPPPLTEAVLSSWICFARYLADENLPVVALELSHARASRRSHAESIVGGPVRFGARQNSLIVPVGILDARSRFADAMLHSAISHCIDDSTRIFVSGTEPLIVQLSAPIMAGLAGGNLREETVAGRIDFTLRSLQRHLAARGYSYRRVLDLIRTNVALLGLSEGDVRLLDIAHRVGFHEQATFSRTVRRWTGRSPREINRLFGADFCTLRNAAPPRRR